MKRGMKKIFAFILACSLLLSGAGINAMAASTAEDAANVTTQAELVKSAKFKVVSSNGEMNTDITFACRCTIDYGWGTPSVVDKADLTYDENGYLVFQLGQYDYAGTYEIYPKAGQGAKVFPAVVPIVVTEDEDWNSSISTINGEPVGAEPMTITIEKNGAKLSKKIAEAKAYNKIEYTADSFATLQTAIQYAEAVLADENADQSAYDQQVTALEQAITKLQEIMKLSSFTIQVEDENKQPVTDIPFEYVDNTGFAQDMSYVNGKLQYTAAGLDSGFSFTVRLHSDAEAEMVSDAITFEVKSIKGSPYVTSINGQLVTGEENLVITIRKAGVSKKALQNKITEAKTKKASAYTADSYASLQNAITAAEAVLADANATQEEVDAEVVSLEDAITALVPSGDVLLTSIKIRVLDEAGIPTTTPKFVMIATTGWAWPFPVEYDKDGNLFYEVYSYDAPDTGEITYNIQLAASETIIVKPERISITLAKVDGEAVITKINGVKVTGKEDLVFQITTDAVNKKELSAKITQAKAVKEEDYTAESYGNLQKAIASAEAVVADENATQEKVDAELESLSTALAGLIGVEKVSLSELKIKVVDSQGNMLSNLKFKYKSEFGYYSYNMTYNTDGYLEYKPDIYDSGKYVVYLDPNETASVSPENISFTVENISGENVITKINDKVVTAGQIPVFTVQGSFVSKKALAERIAYADGLKEADYTAETFAQVKTALQNAKTVNADTDATQSKVDDALSALNTAIDNLKEAPLPGPTSFKVAVVDKKNNPVSGLKFTYVDTSEDPLSKELISDEAGYITYTVSQYDSGYDFELYVSAEENVTVSPAKITFTVAGDFGKAYISKINGVAATGNEALKFVVSNPDDTNEMAFEDVKESDWFVEDVKYVYDRGIMTGKKDTIFAPMDAITRAEFATVLCRSVGGENTTYRPIFKDVKDTDWYKETVTWAYDHNVTTGYGNGMFLPLRTISREELVTMLYRFAKDQNLDVSAKGDLSTFKDSQKVSGFAKEAMKWAVGAGIISGKTNGTTGSYLDPQAGTTRCETAVILHRLLVKYNK